MNNTIEEATPTILSQNSLDPCLAYFRVDDSDVDRYAIEVNDLVEMLYSKNTLVWIEKYELSSNPPLALLLSHHLIQN